MPAIVLSTIHGLSHVILVTTLWWSHYFIAAVEAHEENVTKLVNNRAGIQTQVVTLQSSHSKPLLLWMWPPHQQYHYFTWEIRCRISSLTPNLLKICIYNKIAMLLVPWSLRSTALHHYAILPFETELTIL